MRLFQSNDPCNHKSLQLHIIPSIETNMQNKLLMFVSMEEVKFVIFGFKPIFFKTYLHIVSHDI